jgi:hypothetical protein
MWKEGRREGEGDREGGRGSLANEHVASLVTQMVWREGQGAREAGGGSHADKSFMDW